MTSDYGKIKNLFLRQSYLDSWEDYERSLSKRSFIHWDYVILTASNEEQAGVYREQIAFRMERGLLPEETKYRVLADPEGKRIGSGGATFHVLSYISKESKGVANVFKDKRILVIHSGGDSKRVPQYSACGKLFSPVPRQLPNGRPSTLFDEFVIAMSGVAGRIPEGMLVLSGDVLLLFNPLQIDAQYKGAAAISIKEDVDTGKEHGVFLNDGADYVSRFLHKQSEEKLRKLGAVNDRNCVDLDTGAVLLDTDLLQALFSLISTDNEVDNIKFKEYVNEKARISFYGDFLYPLAQESTLEDYYKEAAEGTICPELLSCREQIWRVLHVFNMKLIRLSPAEFIHFGTTRELLELVTTSVRDYEFLEWSKHVCSNVIQMTNYAIHNSLIEEGAIVGKDAYLENSYVGKRAKVGSNAILSNVALQDETVPENVVLHGLIMNDGSYVVRVYGVIDNPKGTFEENAVYLGGTLQTFVTQNGLIQKDLWEDQESYQWFANLYPVCTSMEEAVHAALVVYAMSVGKATKEQIQTWKDSKRKSLYSSFNEAKVSAILPWKIHLENRIMIEKFVRGLKQEAYYDKVIKVFGTSGMNEEQFTMLMELAKTAEFSLKIRIYYDLYRYMKDNRIFFEGYDDSALEECCFATIKNVIYEEAKKRAKTGKNYHIAKSEVRVELPVRVNWGGGWTDTPPYCNEKGGVVLNAALTLNGIMPVQVAIRKIPELKIAFESADVGVSGEVYSVKEIQDCHNPYDFFALHKAALIACGLIPIEGEADLTTILKNLGGGIYLSTQVVGVPKGSGLGTSSILSGACVKGIFEFLGEELTDKALYDIVLCMEQIMSTGGGWQDQVGGLTKGIKYITTKPGLSQEIEVETLTIQEETKVELKERFALIYTGQRRLARNLLRDVVGHYIEGRPESVQALYEMERVAALMKFELERGNVDEFAGLLNHHWELSKQLDSGSTNTCIEQIFMACEDLICAKFIAGAGGGGFLQVILRKGVTKGQLQERLRSVFQDSGVEVWNCEFV